MTRTTHIQLRTSPEEKAAVQKAASKANLSVSAYLLGRHRETPQEAGERRRSPKRAESRSTPAPTKEKRIAQARQVLQAAATSYRCRCPKDHKTPTMCLDCGWKAT